MTKGLPGGNAVCAPRPQLTSGIFTEQVLVWTWCRPPGCRRLWKPGRLLGLTIHLRVFFCASASFPRLCLPLCLQLFWFFRIKAQAQRSCLWLQRVVVRPCLSSVWWWSESWPTACCFMSQNSCLFRFLVDGISVFVGRNERNRASRDAEERENVLNFLLWQFKPLLSGVM